MANGECKHCGAKPTALPCCQSAIEERARERAERDAVKEQRRAILARHGIAAHEYDSIYRGETVIAPDIVSLFEFLNRLP